VVLGGGADHGRAADVDILHRGVEVRALRHRFLEGIEIDVEQVDAADPVLVHRRFVRGRVAHAEEAAVHQGMQGLHPPVHHLGKAGDVGDVLNGQPGRGDGGLGAAGGDQLDPEVV
jgi:hypothetical protein